MKKRYLMLSVVEIMDGEDFKKPDDMLVYGCLDYDEKDAEGDKIANLIMMRDSVSTMMKKHAH